MCGPWLLTVHDVMSMMEYCFSHFDNIWPVPTHSIKGWAGLKRYCYLGNICRTFRNEMWPVVQFYLSNMSSPVQFRWQSGYQVLPPRRRWDLCQWQLHPLRRKPVYFRVVGEAWRCRAQEFLLGSLAGFWDGCRLWEINSRVWKSKRIEEISVDFHNFHQCWRQSLIANWFKSWCFVVFPFPHVSREQDGCLSLSLFLSMIFWFDAR